MLIERIIAFAIGLPIILAISHAIVTSIATAFLEVKGKELSKKIYFPAVIITSLAIIGLLALLPTCSSQEDVAPNGKTTMEHYEPRW